MFYSAYDVVLDNGEGISVWRLGPRPGLIGYQTLWSDPLSTINKLNPASPEVSRHLGWNSKIRTPS